MMFSIVIPTRARADTLRHALRTVLAQTDGDFEVIVHESGDDPATAAAVAEFDDPRIRFFKTGEPVRMTENWERALAHVRGDYVLFIGDDDGLLPDACAIARGILQAHPNDILSWYFASYYWPRYFDPEMANRLSAACGEKLICTFKESRLLLELFYRFRVSYVDLPMIYNSFVSKRLIDHVRSLHGCYFVGSYPDVASAVANLCFSRAFLHCNRPLSINAASHHSTGHGLVKSADPDAHARVMAAAFGTIPIHPTMAPSFDFTLSLANEMLIIKEQLFPHEEPQFQYTRMLEEVARRVNEIPGQYDAVLAECRAIAEKNGIEFDESHLLPREPLPKPPRLDRRDVQAGTIFIDLDGTARGFANVSDAAAALAEKLPPSTSPEFVVDVGQSRHIAFDGNNSAALDFYNSVTLDFSSRGNGAFALGRGWSIIEHWGVWSIGARSELAFPFERGMRGSLAFQLIGFVFLPPRTMTICLKAGSRVLLQRELHVVGDRVDLELPPIEVEASGPTKKLDLIIGINEGKTPMEAGVCPDPRRVGFGLERIVIRMNDRPRSRVASVARWFRRVRLTVHELTAR
jgi:hypothetical protein